MGSGRRRGVWDQVGGFFLLKIVKHLGSCIDGYLELSDCYQYVVICLDYFGYQIFDASVFVISKK